MRQLLDLWQFLPKRLIVAAIAGIFLCCFLGYMIERRRCMVKVRRRRISSYQLQRKGQR